MGLDDFTTAFDSMNILHKLVSLKFAKTDKYIFIHYVLNTWV
jgi:hypothetical protein